MLYSRHFPDEFQGNFLNCNVIGLQGIFRVKVSEDGSGLKGETLDELVEHKYLRGVPIDPMTESNSTWITVPSNELDKKGIADVKSGASGHTHDGKAYDAL